MDPARPLPPDYRREKERLPLDQWIIADTHDLRRWAIRSVVVTGLSIAAGAGGVCIGLLVLDAFQVIAPLRPEMLNLIKVILGAEGFGGLAGGVNIMFRWLFPARDH